LSFSLLHDTSELESVQKSCEQQVERMREELNSFRQKARLMLQDKDNQIQAWTKKSKVCQIFQQQLWQIFQQQHSQIIFTCSFARISFCSFFPTYFNVGTQQSKTGEFAEFPMSIVHTDFTSHDNPTTGIVSPDADATPSDNLFGKGQLALRIPLQLNAIATGPSLVIFLILVFSYHPSSFCTCAHYMLG
jgi:hypothetical protein